MILWESNKYGYQIEGVSIKRDMKEREGEVGHCLSLIILCISLILLLQVKGLSQRNNQCLGLIILVISL